MVHRCGEFYEARRVFGELDDPVLGGGVDVDGLAHLQRIFLKWYDKYREGRVVCLSGDSDWVFVRAVCRFMDEYKSWVRRRLWLLLKDVKFDLMLTFTMDNIG